MSDFKHIPCIFPGHGGYVDGTYVTKPSKMHTFEDGLTVEEGVINRQICRKVGKYLNSVGFPYIYIDTELDTPLKTKTEIAERYQSTIGNCFLLDIHNNAGGGTGSEVYTSPGDTASDPISTAIYKEVDKIKDWEVRPDYQDGDPDKEAKFYVLMNTYLPSVLFEGGFMDTRSDAEFITSDGGQNKLALAIANGILSINGRNLINATTKKTSTKRSKNGKQS